MPFLIVIILAVGWYLVRRIKNRFSRPAFQHVRCWESPLTPDLARDTIAMFLDKLGYQHRTHQDGIDVYFCGDASVTRISSARFVGWNDFPRFTAVRVAAAANGVLVTLLIEPLPTVEVAPVMAALFHDCARKEAEGAVGLLEELVEEVKRQSRQTRNARPCAPAALPSDLATLGVRPGASWDEVQAAYREACMKYHPDRLAGQSVAPHLKDLAVRRFTEVSAAYERLRSNRPAGDRR